MQSIKVKREFSRRTYEDGLAAYGDSNHLCHSFVQWQERNDCPEFQLPEAFSGRREVTAIGV